MSIDDKSLFPTSFAIELLRECEFLPEKEKGGHNIIKIEKLKGLIADFQKMAVCVDFDESMIVFHGFEINENQREVLKIIHKSTKPYVMGETIGACLDSITFRTLGKNEFAEAIKTIVEQASVKKPTSDGNDKNKRMRGILVRVSKSD